MLVARPDAVKNLARHVGDAVVALYEHFHSVFQGFCCDGKLLRFVLRFCRVSEAQHADKCCDDKEPLGHSHRHTLSTGLLLSQTYKTQKKFSRLSRNQCKNARCSSGPAL